MNNDQLGNETDRISAVPDPRSELSQEVAGVLSDLWPNEIYTVEDRTVWVSGMNANCVQIARMMAKHLVHSEDIPCSLVRDDGLVFGGVEFDYFDPDMLENDCRVNPEQ